MLRAFRPAAHCMVPAPAAPPVPASSATARPAPDCSAPRHSPGRAPSRCGCGLCPTTDPATDGSSSRRSGVPRKDVLPPHPRFPSHAISSEAKPPRALIMASFSVPYCSRSTRGALQFVLPAFRVTVILGRSTSSNRSRIAASSPRPYR